jgi:cytidylate kinase
VSEVSPDSMVVVGRRRGRPKSAEPGSTVSTWIPASEHDRLVRIANRHEMSVSEYVGAVLRRDIRTRLEPNR